MTTRTREPKGAGVPVQLWACDCSYNWTPFTCGERDCGQEARPIDYIPARPADDLARAVREIVDSFTDTNGDFIRDDLTSVEYEQLRGALAHFPTDRSEDA